MSKTLGGSIFVRNAVKFGYCLIEALDSLYALCDQVSVLECGSDDGTQELLVGWVRGKKNVTTQFNHPWEVAPDYHRLAVLGNVARSRLTTDWHFLLQADEVIHEMAFPIVRRLIEGDPMAGYYCRRFNLFGSPDTHIRLDSKKKPCSDAPVRLARTALPVHGDGEGLGGEHYVPRMEFVDQMPIYHYGYVREGPKHIAKVIDMQSWFFGPGSQPDERVVKMRDNGNKFDCSAWFSSDDLAPNPHPHPMFSAKLAEHLRVMG